MLLVIDVGNTNIVAGVFARTASPQADIFLLYIIAPGK